MVDMVASGMAASENAARVYGNGEERFSSKAPAGKNSVGKSDGAGNTVEKAGTSFHKYIENAIQKETRAFTEGKDVVMACPPLYRTNYQVDMNKPREEMSLDEYKQYICNTISSLSVSDSKRVCGNGVLIFKEEALENMKNDSAYEQEVIRMLGENFSKQLSDYEPYVEYQVIGKTKEECYGASIPLKSYGWMMGVQSGLASRLLLGSGSTLSGYGLVRSTDFESIRVWAGIVRSADFESIRVWAGIVRSADFKLIRNGPDIVRFAGRKPFRPGTSGLRAIRVRTVILRSVFPRNADSWCKSGEHGECV